MKIKQGNHSSGLHFNLLPPGCELTYKVTFTESCKYSTWKSDSSIHKLFGIGFFPYHRINSIRFGWSYEGTELIRIHKYIYKDGVRTIEPLTWVPVNEPAYLSIFSDKESQSYGMICQHVVEQVKMKPQFGYQLYPYFGGRWKAPHDIEIKMVKIS